MVRAPSGRLDNILSGDTSYFGGSKTDGPLAGRIRAEQLYIVLNNTKSGMVANIVNATIAIIAFWGTPDRYLILGWGGVLILGAGYLLVRARTSVRPVKPLFVSRRSMRKLVLGAFIQGLWWSILPLFFFAGAASETQVIIACIAAGMISGATSLMSTIPIACIAYAGPIFISSIVSIALAGSSYYPVSALVFSYAVILFRAIFSHAFEFTERLVQQDRNEREIRTDALTGLPNRLGHDEFLEHEGAKEDGLALILLDVDNLRIVRERHGRAIGDAVLVEIASRLREAVREDRGVFRIGSDAFSMIVSGETEPEELAALCRDVIATLRQPIGLDGRTIQCTISAGIARSRSDDLDGVRLLRNADIALYRARRAGGASIEFYGGDDDEASARRHRLEHDLALAITRNELFVVFQPFLDVQGGRVTGFETLLRWQHPELGLVPPSEFIPIAEEAGQIHALGQWSLRQACTIARAWPGDLRLAINLSAEQFACDQLEPVVLGILSETDFPPERLELEVTETSLIADIDLARERLEALAKHGIEIALDDFGVGYSSFSYLVKLPLARLKIDQSFVRDMTPGSGSAAIVSSLISLAEQLGLAVTAEGVETPEQLDQLREMGCGEVQGYLIGKPIAADLVADLLGQGGGMVTD